ncbi:MAG: hypothetical protein JO258_00495 [Alphaproteobacteria bacterium]|nr:hypothetical protein [Alphaproteobacteria bacterium]
MTGKGYEPRDIPPKGAAMALGGVLLSLLAVGAIVAGLLGWIGSHYPARMPVAPGPVRSPQLQVAPDRTAIETAAKARLKGDAAHPSIEEAMRQVATEGWHDRAPAPSPARAARGHSEGGK